MKMTNCIKTGKDEQEKRTESFRSVLDEIVRSGAQKMLQAAVDAEVEDFIEKNKSRTIDNELQAVVRNGYHPERSIASGAGYLAIRQPRVRERDGKKTYSCYILPKYMRRTPSVEAVVPILYLKGISTNDFPDALRSLLGDTVRDLSAATIVRMKQIWEQDYKDWENRDLSEKQYVYFWVDGIHFNVRLKDEKQCILVIIGATADGHKELVAVQDGFRESKESWMYLLRSLKDRGLKCAPKLAIGDGALGFWAACGEQFPETREQLCWVHKTANILDKLPTALQGIAKIQIHNIYLAETKEAALKAYDSFMHQFSAKYPKACESLSRHKDMLFTFYDFPAEHWSHIRTTNPIESTFATVRLRTNGTKGCGSRIATLTMVFKLIQEAEKRWLRLRAHNLISQVLRGDIFVDGIIKAA